MRQHDRVYRYGGEALAVLINLASPDAAVEVARRLLSSVRELVIEHADNEPGIITASAGVAHWHERLDDGHDLIRAADAALYQAKRAGRDRLECAGVHT